MLVYEGQLLMLIFCWHLGPKGLRVGQYYNELHQSVQNKSDAGFNTTITDYWGRALSYQLVNSTDGGPGMNPSN